MTCAVPSCCRSCHKYYIMIIMIIMIIIIFFIPPFSPTEYISVPDLQQLPHLLPHQRTSPTPYQSIGYTPHSVSYIFNCLKYRSTIISHQLFVLPFTVINGQEFGRLTLYLPILTSQRNISSVLDTERTGTLLFFKRMNTIHNYNFFMGSVDVADQLRRTHRVGNCSRNIKWWQSLLFWT